MRTLIKDLEENKKVKISGWVTKVRDTKWMLFIIVKDISGSIQVSLDKGTQNNLIEKFKGILENSVVSFTGEVKRNENVRLNGQEFISSDGEILSNALPLPIIDKANIDNRLNYRWLDLRNNDKYMIFLIQTAFIGGMREYLLNNSFTEIHTPKLIATASESGSEVFEVKYFKDKAYLAQSPQFYKQMAIASGLERVFEIAPAFRAENSNTNRHTTEFTSLDVEMAYIDSYLDVMNLEEDLLIAGLTKVKDLYGEYIKENFEKEIVIPKKPFPRIKLNDLYQELAKRYNYHIPEFDVGDMNKEAEALASKYALEEYGHEFIFITGFAKTKRAFYHMRKNDIPEGYDLIWRGCEITTGAQREHRYEILAKQAQEKGLGKDVDFYLQFFKYGCPPHGGFAIGVDRLTMLLLGLPNLKETMFIFRGPNRLTP